MCWVILGQCLLLRYAKINLDTKNGCLLILWDKLKFRLNVVSVTGNRIAELEMHLFVAKVITLSDLS